MAMGPSGSSTSGARRPTGKVETEVSVPSVNSQNYGAAQSSKANGALDNEQFLQLLVGQLKNQNPMDPTDTNQLLNQMVSYASYGQQEANTAALEKISTTLDGIASALALIIQEKQS